MTGSVPTFSEAGPRPVRRPGRSSGASGNSNWSTGARPVPGRGRSWPPPGPSPAGHGSKLAKALAAHRRGGNHGQTGPAAPVPKPPRKKAPVSDLLTAYLAAQIREILAHDPGVRLEEPEAVHDLRSATRRARSALAAYRRLYSAVTVRRLRDELKWLGGMLGIAARRRSDAGPAARAHRASCRPGPAVEGGGRTGSKKNSAIPWTPPTGNSRKRCLSERYFRLLDDLEAFRDHPPSRPEGAAPARKAAGKLVGKAPNGCSAVSTGRPSVPAGEPSTRPPSTRSARTPRRLRHVAESVGPRPRQARRRKSPRPRTASRRSSAISRTAWWPGTCWPSWRQRRTCPNRGLGLRHAPHPAGPAGSRGRGEVPEGAQEVPEASSTPGCLGPI